MRPKTGTGFEDFNEIEDELVSCKMTPAVAIAGGPFFEEPSYFLNQPM